MRGRCFRCGKKGHQVANCPESKPVRCGTCKGYGHDKSKCPTEEAVLVVEVPAGGTSADATALDVAEEALVVETRRSSIQVLEDNQGAMALVQNPLSSGRTKHIDVRFHFIRGLFRLGEISVKFVPTTEQHADVLTKALSRASLQYHRRKLMNLPE
ncbi:unnamed protein product [Ectocarpus sp. CCAP 1310/34]|nr:unnamed protein product [Ectocarpus sp. CCAP 1310/34]